MAREYLNPGFSLGDILDAMAVTDQAGGVAGPELYDSEGRKFNSILDAQEALKKGKAVIAVEHNMSLLSNVVYCAKGPDGKLAISPSKAVEYAKFSKTLAGVRKRPSLGRRIAYRFSRHKEKYTDIARYKQSKAAFDEVIKDGIQSDWQKHLAGEPVTMIKTMENEDNGDYHNIADETAKLREKFKDKLPGERPIESGFEDARILMNPAALKAHARKKQITAQNNLFRASDYGDSANFANAYPGIDTSNLTETQKKALGFGLRSKIDMYGILAEKDIAMPWEGSSRSLAELATAQYMHYLLYKAQRDPNGPESKQLEFFNDPENLEKFVSKVQEGIGDEQMYVDDIHTFLETGDGAKKLFGKANAAFESIQLGQTAPAKTEPEVGSKAIANDEPSREADYIESRFDQVDDPSLYEDDPVNDTIMERFEFASKTIDKELEVSVDGAIDFNPDIVADFMLGQAYKTAKELKDIPGNEQYKELYEYLCDPENVDVARMLLKGKMNNKPVNVFELADYIGGGDGISPATDIVEKVMKQDKQNTKDVPEASKVIVSKIKAEKQIYAAEMGANAVIETDKPIQPGMYARQKF